MHKLTRSVNPMQGDARDSIGFFFQFAAFTWKTRSNENANGGRLKRWDGMGAMENPTLMPESAEKRNRIRQSFFQAKNNQFRSLEPSKMEICLPTPHSTHVETSQIWNGKFSTSLAECGRGRHILPYSIAISLSCFKMCPHDVQIENVMQMFCPVAFSIRASMWTMNELADGPSGAEKKLHEHAKRRRFDKDELITTRAW